MTATAAYLQHPAVPLLGRLFITYIFATSALGKMFAWSGQAAYMSTHNLHMIPLLLAIALLIEVVGSLCLIAGYQARIAAFVMFLYLLAVTVLLHNYWAYSGMTAGMMETEFRKNLAIMGGLLMIAAAGPGKWAVG